LRKKETITHWLPAWRLYQSSVFKCLSSTDASKKNKDGSILIGREEERQQLTFFREAVRGDAKDSKSSIFVAVPPGVGKIANIRAVVHDFKQKQYKGLIPKFRFLSLDGMELCHLLEAYVTFWELIAASHILPKIAAKTIDHYFCQSQSKIGEGGTFVLLLDEVDYFLTKDQSVIHNFDRAMQATQKHVC
jgi:Cdc6-like AAA superfamily ATPase